MNLSTHFCHYSRCTAGIEDVLASCRACEIFSLSTMVNSCLNGYFLQASQKSQSFVSSFFYPNIVQCVNLRHFHLVTSLFTYFISKYSPGALVIQLFAVNTVNTVNTSFLSQPLSRCTKRQRTRHRSVRTVPRRSHACACTCFFSSSGQQVWLSQPRPLADRSCGRGDELHVPPQP